MSTQIKCSSEQKILPQISLREKKLAPNTKQRIPRLRPNMLT
uniref:Uncharacterized protein n=1 Tax=Arundo donax TaxID=35708 RepID=A0A0A9DQ49_ARUDO